MTSSPLPKSTSSPEDSEPFICPICDQDISANGPSNLNLDNCRCGESGATINDREDAKAASDSQSKTVREVETMEADSTVVHGTEEHMKHSNSSKQIPKSSERVLREKLTSQNIQSNLSFAMIVYLSQTHMQESPCHEHLGLNDAVARPSGNFDCSSFEFPSCNIPDTDTSLLLPSPKAPPTSTSTCATKATSSMRSSLSSSKSWESQVRSYMNDSVIGTGAWQDALELSWLSALHEDLYGK